MANWFVKVSRSSTNHLHSPLWLQQNHIQDQLVCEVARFLHPPLSTVLWLKQSHVRVEDQLVMWSFQGSPLSTSALFSLATTDWIHVLYTWSSTHCLVTVPGRKLVRSCKLRSRPPLGGCYTQSYSFLTLATKYYYIGVYSTYLRLDASTKCLKLFYTSPQPILG
jgi:hypothetical protein